MQSIVHSVYFSNDRLKASAHHHDCHQIIFILKGRTEISVNGEKYNAAAGSIALFSRYENHAVTVMSDEYERYVLRINPRVYNGRGKIYSLLSNRPSGFCNVFDTAKKQSEIKRIFDLILAEYGSADGLCEEMLTALVDQLLITVCRFLPDYGGYLDEHSFGSILELQKKLENDYCTDHTLEGLAKSCNMSVSSLSHLFKKITGTSVMNYLLSCRIAGAKNLLTKTDLSISEIVGRCGFSDSSNFSRTFKKLNGVTPTDFRKKYKTE